MFVAREMRDVSGDVRRPYTSDVLRRAYKRRCTTSRRVGAIE